MTTFQNPRVVERHASNERGSALVLVLIIAVLLAGLGMASLSRTEHEVTLSGFQAERETAFQAAQAGVDDYIAKVTTDHLYYYHKVHPAESTRRDTSTPAVVAASGSDWTGANSWTYPTVRDAWVTLVNGYQYNLEVTPPSGPTGNITMVVATGRRGTNPRSLRTIEVSFKGSSVADFQLMTDAPIWFGKNETTSGQVYSSKSIRMDGVAKAPLISLQPNDVSPGASWNNLNASPPALTGVYGAGYWVAEGFGAGVTYGSKKVKLVENGAIYDASNYTKIISKKPDFSAFAQQLTSVKRAAQSISTNAKFFFPFDPSIDGYFFKFAAAGTVSVYRCKRSGTLQLGQSSAAKSQPSCTVDPSYVSVPLPKNGAIYSEMSVLVAGVVKGEVTVVSEVDGIVGDPTAVNSHSTSSPMVDVIKYNTRGKDVLGLVAARDIVVAEWGPANQAIMLSLIAQGGRYRSGCIGGGDNYNTPTVKVPNATRTGSVLETKVTVPTCAVTAWELSFTGSMATPLQAYDASADGVSGLFNGPETYNYDDNLRYLIPPLFPVVDDAYKIVRFREVNPR